MQSKSIPTHLLSSIILITSVPLEPDRLQLVLDHHLTPSITPGFDTLILTTDTSIGIDQVRSLQTFFATKPAISNTKTAIIPEAELLTPEAQHALLKILEEPPTFARIILMVGHLHQLLPTIISRCQTISLEVPNSSESDPEPNLLSTFTGKNPGELISLSDKYNQSKSDALEFCRQLTISLTHTLRACPSQPLLYNLTLSLYTTKLLTQNINPKLAIDNLLLRLK